MNKWKLITCLFFIFMGTSSLAQDFSNKGKEFWVAYPSHIDGTNSVMGLYFTSTEQATVNVVAAGISLPPVTLTPNQVQRVFLGGAGNPTNTGVYLNSSDGIKPGAGIKITSDKNIVVYSHIIRSARSGATLVLPTNVLGIEYIVPSYGSKTLQGNTSGISQFAVVATKDNTKIEITPTVNKPQSGSTPARLAGVPYQIDLPNVGDCYQFQTNQLDDLSGTIIKSISTGTDGCKPIAIFSGSTWATIGCDPIKTNTGGTISPSGGDNLFQQVTPTKSWGKQFVTAPFKNKTLDVYRIFLLSPGTQVTVKENGIERTLGPSDFKSTIKCYEILSGSPLQITSDKQISVVQYITSQSCSPGTFSDPEMVILNPIEQTLSEITFFSAHASYVPAGQTQVTQHYLNLIIDKKYQSSLKIDNSLPTGTFIDIPGTNFSYLQENLTTSSASNPVHSIKADTGFIAIVYGYGDVESYGYNAGANVKDLYQTLTTNNKFATVKIPATCKGTPFKISITLPYEPVSLEWKVPNYPPIPKVNAPVFDTSYLVSGKKIYRYSLSDPYIYNTVGTYNIQVIANNPTPDGCPGEQQIDFDLQVFERPVAKIDVVTTNCITDSISFRDISPAASRPIVGYSWEMDDGNFRTLKNFNYKYLNPGKYTIKYYAYTDVGCLTDTITQDVFLDSVPISNFSITAPTCQNKDVTFVDGSRPRGLASIKEWLWVTNSTFTNSTNASVVEKFTGLQDYTVQLRVKTQNGCLSPVKSITFTNRPNPTVTFSLPKICLPDGMGTFNDQSTISDGSQSSFIRNWYFGDPNATPTNIDTALNRISPSHKYTAVGPYTVKLIIRSNHGCVDSLSQQLTDVFAQPVAKFTVIPEVCLRENTKMTDQTNAQGRTMAKWNWTLSNGLKDTLKNPLFTLTAAGTYSAEMFGYSEDGCISTIAKETFVVHPLPIANFKVVGPACETETVTFEQTSTAGVGNLTRWNWRLGNATTPQDLTTSVTKTFTNWGSQVIKLMVENSKGCKSDTASQTIKIHPKPFVKNSVPEVCLKDEARFFDSTLIADNSTGFSHMWNFNDINASPTNPDSSNLKNPTHKYTAANTYTISHKVTSLAGCVSVKSTTFVVSGAIPTSNFEVLLPDSLCSNDTVRIKNLSTVDFGFIGKLEIYWDYDNYPNVKETDQLPDSAKIYTHVYPRFFNQSKKSVRILVRAYSGGTCFDDKNSPVTLLGSPVVKFDAVPGICLDGSPRQITQTKYTDVYGIAPGDSIFTGKGVSAKGLYTPLSAGAGTYVLKYTFTASNGCKDTASRSIIVWPRPTADFEFSVLTCERNPITFTSKSVPNAGNLVKWNWNFGDGSTTKTVDNANPLSYTYDLYKSYNVSLDVTTNNGCKSQIKTIPVMVYPLPVVKFDLPKVCLPEGKALFKNNSTIPDGSTGLISYLWNFGDLANPTPDVTIDGTHNYLSLGSYTVKLVATSNNNCKDSLTKQLVDVFPQPKASYTSLDSACLGKSIQFSDKSNGFVRPITAWNWDFGNNTTENIKDPLYLYKATGTYKVSLYVTTSEGCISDTLTKSITIHPYPKISAGPDMSVLDDGQKIIPATATGNVLIYKWSPVTYLNFADILQPIVEKPQDDIVYTLSVTGRGNCTSTDKIAVTVLKFPKAPNTFTPNGDGYNDVWDIKHLDRYPGYVIEVYSPQGQLVFKSDGSTKIMGWEV